ncbi:MAG: potassium channel protein [Candidatus Binatia bacterium]
MNRRGRYRPVRVPRPIIDDPRFLNAAVLILVLTVVGTCGYRILEGYSWLDSLYMTVITLSTVGYREMAPLSTAGKVFTLALIVVGIGIVLTIVSMWAALVLDGEFQKFITRRRIAKMIDKMKDHYIVCGYGRFGRRVVDELRERGTPIVIIEAEAATPDDIPSIQGDATHDEVLVEAGIERARGVLCTMSSEASNLAISLAAKDLNPEIYVVARAEDEANTKRLVRAGASRTVAPYAVAGHRMALAAMHPRMVEVGGLATLAGEPGMSLAEVSVMEGSFCDGVTLAESDIPGRFGVTVLGLLDASGELRLHPPAGLRLEAGQVLLAVGHPTALEKLASELGA